ncbi:MAG: PEP-CTERM sorting domain-containing protein, partial [Tatlockia sp.]|nr:PEP-CTERM sorting domain-containing protein [Tatlockia sp.]
NLATGAASSLGEIGGSRSLTGLAAQPVPEPSSVIGSLAAVTLGGVAVMRRRRRSAQLSKF